MSECVPKPGNDHSLNSEVVRGLTTLAPTIPGIAAYKIIKCQLLVLLQYLDTKYYN